MGGRPLANDDPEGQASCRWSSGGAGLLQMMIRRDRPLADGHPEGPLANDDTEGLASCRWSSGGTGLLQMIIRRAATVRGVIEVLKFFIVWSYMVVGVGVDENLTDSWTPGAKDFLPKKKKFQPKPKKAKKKK